MNTNKSKSILHISRCKKFKYRMLCHSKEKMQPKVANSVFWQSLLKVKKKSLETFAKHVGWFLCSYTLKSICLIPFGDGWFPLDSIYAICLSRLINVLNVWFYVYIYSFILEWKHDKLNYSVRNMHALLRLW